LGPTPKGRKSRQKAEGGWGSWAASPLPTKRGSGERCELPQQGFELLGGAPTAQRFPTIFSIPDGVS